MKTYHYRAREIAIGITLTGGQCRASNYLSLIRKAMIKAGFDDIPIISVTASQGLIDQPWFNRHFGGIFYLFIRGMHPDFGSQYGVFYDRPAKVDISCLSDNL